MTLGVPTRPDDWVGVWGASPTAARGVALAARSGHRVLRIEDAFLRSVRPGPDTAPLGLLLDRTGLHFDARTPFDLETLLASHPLDDPALMQRATDGIAMMRHWHLSKYCAFDPDLPLPDSLPRAPFVLVVDQTAGDAALAGADPGAVRRMLDQARDLHPGLPVVLKTHPAVHPGGKRGHFGPGDAGPGVTLLSDPVSPWALFDRAAQVHTWSSTLGFEAILAGHRPHVHGSPFYAGWGLTVDHGPALPRRGRALTPAQVFAAAMLLAPAWHHPALDRPCAWEDAARHLAAASGAARQDARGWVAMGIAPWKRAHVRAMFGDVRFAHGTAGGMQGLAQGRRAMAWGTRVPPDWPATLPLARLEDAVLRSRGLGADLVPPLALGLDDMGLPCDPAQDTRLERLIAASVQLSPGELARAGALVGRIVAAGLSKYSVGRDAVPDLPPGPRVLVAGQVEDDASVRLGATGAIRTNAALLVAARAAHPAAVLLWKPHPDVEAGLRRGTVAPGLLAETGAIPLPALSAHAALAVSDEVWTMTSGLGWEALLRGRPVTCAGMPWYGGWGLTTDLVPAPQRRSARPSVAGLAHAALIGWPRWHDPVSGLVCAAETGIERLSPGAMPPPPHRLAARLQGWLWRAGLRR
ncbi:MAG: capsular polysaccharide biosynthesis protein [Rhodobacteraceae bacterium]|nr:capsular polysaccharide biosynthesis protein [Paracoccaceae bacterium]